MVTMETTAQSTIQNRMTKLETIIETERPHLATKADLERQTRLIVIWFIGTWLGTIGVLVTLAGIVIGLILSRLP